ncbi:hypothetical protein RhiirA4_471680 [Rhizophagus irregularis]|uniref:Uncharacterized protein n=1 Tax=Rhizophagus irregularis TaxID=588596 RepID=A0A2I1H3K4_9GLOM|nr:hypothetical protein RhiirA4_471680 [Rhizophagus irregularis]
MSRNRKVCQNCRSKVINTPSPPPQNVFKDYSQVKQIISKRIGVTYTKKVLRHNGSVSSRIGYNALKEIFVNHSFNKEHFLELRTKKEALFDPKNNTVTEQSNNLNQEILEKKIAITKPEFHRGLNNVRDLDVLRIYSNGVKKKKRGYGVTYIYVDTQCSARARKIAKGLWH